MVNSSPAKPDRTALLCLAGIVLVALVTRVIYIGESSFWTDEAYSLWFARHSLNYLWSVLLTYESHPPLYYTILHVWRVFGESEGALRSLSVVFSLGVVALTALAGRDVGGSRPRFVMLATAALLAFAPLQVEYAQEARPYAALSAAVALLLYSGVRLANHPERAGRYFWREPALWAPVALGLILTPWFHYVGLFYAFAFGLFLLFVWVADHRLRWPFFVNVAVVGLVALAIFSPQLGSMLTSTGDWTKSTWVPKPERWSIALVLQEVFAVTTGPAPRFIGRIVLLLGVVAVSAGALRLWFTARRSIAVLLVSVAIVPFALILLISLISTPIFMLRVVVPSQAPSCILLAIALAALPWRPLAGALLGVILATFVYLDFTTVYRAQDEPWRDIANDIASRARPGDLVIVAPNEAMIPFELYFRAPPGVAAPLVVPAPYPATGLAAPYPAGMRAVPGITPQSAADAARIADSYDGSVFLILRDAEIYDPEGDLERALSGTRTSQGALDYDIGVKVFGPPRSTK